MSEQNGQIHKAIVAVMREVGAIGKDHQNQHQKYKFRGIEDVYNRVQPLFAKHGIYSAPKVIDQRREVGTTKSAGELHYSILTVEYTFFCEDGSSIIVAVVGEGMDSGDKASNKALSAAHKYAICQLLNIPYQIVDPEKHSPEWSASLRGRVTQANIDQLKYDWLEKHKGKKLLIDDATAKEVDAMTRDELAVAFANLVEEWTGHRLDLQDFRQWTTADLKACNAHINPDPFEAGGRKQQKEKAAT